MAVCGLLGRLILGCDALSDLVGALVVPPINVRIRVGWECVSRKTGWERLARSRMSKVPIVDGVLKKRNVFGRTQKNFE